MADNLDESNVVHKKVVGDSPKLHKGKFLLNFPKVISEFENAMHKFPVKKILYKVIFRGKGLEFDSYRNFSPDDDASFIDWKASLRANDLLAKKYIEERDLNIYFLVDVSNSMLFGSTNKLKAEFVAEFVVSLSHLIIGSGDNIGLVMFSDDVVKILRPAKGKNQFALFMKFLSDSSLYGGGFDLNKAIEHVLRMVNSPYTVFILVSDFIKTKKDSARELRLMGSKFETLAVMIRDPLDENLPETKYQFSVQDPYSHKQMILDPDIAAKMYRKNVIKQKGILKEMFKHSGIDLLELITDKGLVIPLSTFLKQRATGGRI
ncbi:MAG: DUF58 domain-containing protein [archaeon]